MSLSKGFKRLGRSIHWTDIRVPVVAAAAGAATGGALGFLGLVGTEAAASASAALGTTVSAATVGAVGGAAVGAGVGAVANMQERASDYQKALQKETAVREAAMAEAAMLSPTEAATQSTMQADQFAEQADVTRRRRAFGLARTTISGGLLGGYSSL